MANKQRRDDATILFDMLEVCRIASTISTLATNSNLSTTEARRRIELMKANSLIREIPVSESGARKSSIGRDYGTKFAITEKGIELLREYNHLADMLRHISQ
ncbi:MAG TPA: winged helix-turn-helix domain-containing protein [Candidatus Acidoferrales bacterium]|nr:winged helix-turn-helix domain-containing protein [Candidatus Acidoferrales bacterium]